MKQIFWVRRFHVTGDGPKIRVRFAPSPTGFLHIGGLRTALYNYLFAKSKGGSFILRIEDTDQKRCMPGSLDNLQKVLEWVGLKPDEGPFSVGEYGPYIQSERLGLYHKYAKNLLEKNTAYYCFCTEKRLDLLRKDAVRHGQIPKYDNHCRKLPVSVVDSKLRQNVPYVIRFKMDSFLHHIKDLVYGQITHNPGNTEGDPILIKSDGFPTYHFASVVDDHLMEISHVLRGVEWQVSTPKHILLYKAFGWQPPQFAHIPVIVNSDGSKLSKRQGDVHVGHLKCEGYFPEAVLNFTFQMGGGFAESEINKIYCLQDMIAKFSLSKISTVPCVMDSNRLEACNRLVIERHLKTDEGASLLASTVRKLVLQRFGQSAVIDLSNAYIRKVINLFKDRITRLTQITSDETSYLWIQNYNVKSLNTEELPFQLISDIVYELDTLDSHSFTKEHIIAKLQHFSTNKPVQLSTLMKMIRYLVTGRMEGPAIADVLEVLGKEVSIKRIALNVPHRNIT